MKNIEELLIEKFNRPLEYPQKRRIIFWYDDHGENIDIIDAIKDKDIHILKVEKTKDIDGNLVFSNIFKIKYKIEIQKPETNFLIYNIYGKSQDKKKNFLLDIEEYSEEFKTNREVIMATELGFDSTDTYVLKILKKYKMFFNSKERRNRFIHLLNGSRNVNLIELAILSTIGKVSSMEIEDLIGMVILDRGVISDFEKYNILDTFFNIVYNRYKIHIRSVDELIKYLLVVHTFKSIEEDFEVEFESYSKGDSTEIYLLTENLLINNKYSDALIKGFEIAEKEVATYKVLEKLPLDRLVKINSLGEREPLIIDEICSRINTTLEDYSQLKNLIKERLRLPHFDKDYSVIYLSMMASINFFEALERFKNTNLKDSFVIYKGYQEEYYKIDKYYREFYYNYDNFRSSFINSNIESLERKIKLIYESEYLDSLLIRWSEGIENLTTFPQQTNFYKDHIKDIDSRVVVIISDALRYEVGVDLRDSIHKNVSIRDIEIDSMITSIPSITSIGMASLLPNNGIEYNVLENKSTISSRSTTSLKDREEILKKENPISSAISYKDFKNKYRNEQEDYIKGKKVIYIYHDKIDAIGDKAKTEFDTFAACQTTIEEISEITKNLVSLGVVNVMITSDHGFLYERMDVPEYNKIDLKNLNCVSKSKRYAIYNETGEGILERGCVGIKTNFGDILFPKGNQRIKSSGGGSQFVHGGISLQEVIIPLIKIKAGSHSQVSEKVSLKIRDSVIKITEQSTKFSLYQIEGINGQNRVKERDILVALYSVEGIRISEEEKIRLDSDRNNSIHEFRLSIKKGIKKAILKVKDIETKEILDYREYSVTID